MPCFKDHVWCPFWATCTDGPTCEVALTEDILNQAEVWWGSKNAPVSQYLEKPGCFKGVDNGPR